MAIYELDGDTPDIGESCWIAASAEVIGRVQIGRDVSIWFGTVIRGDQRELIQIGQGSNIQDCCVLHSDPGMPLTIGKHVTVGHRVVLHGCTIGDESLIGIGAVILNGAKIGNRCLVGAGALVTQGKEFPDGSLIIGCPAVLGRPLSYEHTREIEKAAAHYRSNAQRFERTLRKII